MGVQGSSASAPDIDQDQVTDKNDFPTDIYGNYFNTSWAQAEPGLIRDLNYGDPHNWPHVQGDTDKIIITDQKSVQLSDYQGAISWETGSAKYDTTFILIRNCDEVVLSNIHLLQRDSDYRASHTIIVEDCNYVELKDSSFHGAVLLYHVRMEGNKLVLIDNVEVSGYDYGSDVIRTGGGIWIENGDEGRGGIGVDSMRSPNPNNLEWFQITNSFFHDHRSNPENRNQDGILIHSGSNGLVYNNLFLNWIERDAVFDVSHRRWQDDMYTDKTIRIEKNIFKNNHYVKSPGRSILQNSIYYTNNIFENTSFACYHHGYPVIFNDNIFKNAFLPTFFALWGVTGDIKMSQNEFLFNDLYSFFREGGSATDQDHSHLNLINNIYYLGNVEYWLNGLSVNAKTWNEWIALGLDSNSVRKDASTFPYQ